jgi:predicted small secreted protein
MEMDMSKKITSPLIAFAALIGAASLTACNTVEGVGQDVEAAGQTIEETAQEANDGNPNTP